VFLSLQKNSKTNLDAAKRKFAVHEGDHLTLLNVYISFMKNNQAQKWCQHHYINFKAMQRATDVRQQLEKYLKKFKVPLVSAKGEAEKIVKAIVTGYFHNAATIQSDGTYKTLRSNHRLSIHPSSALFKNPPQWLVYHEIIVTNKEYMRDCTAIESSWLQEIAPHFYQFQHNTLQKVDK